MPHPIRIRHFDYDAHDKLTSGTAGSETDGYDANGNETSVNIFGGFYTLTYDDEDRMTSITSSGRMVNTFVYNGLGMRVGKTDSTGTYSYLCDGTTPGSAVLSDGAAVYTPGQSEHRAGASSYPDFDSLGNILTIDAASGTVTQAGYLVTGFGTPLYTTGSSPTPFKYGGANGCQTDNDTGLILMGHRYYDTRIGRFISQDPAGDGDNWYAYCDNSPTNAIDPDGLTEELVGTLQLPGSWNKEDITEYLELNYDPGSYVVDKGKPWAYTITISAMPQVNGIAPGTGMAMGMAGKMPPLSAYKNALKQLHAKYGSIPKVKGQVGRQHGRVRISGKRRYRLDSGHPNATTEAEKGIHFNYEDYTDGKANTGRAIEDVFPIEGGEGIMIEDIGPEGFIGSAEGVGAVGGTAAEGLTAADVILDILLGAAALF